MWEVIKKLGGRPGLASICEEAQSNCLLAKLRTELSKKNIRDIPSADLKKLLGKSGPTVSRFKKDAAAFLIKNRKIGEIVDVLLKLGVDPARVIPSLSEVRVAVARDTLAAAGQGDALTAELISKVLLGADLVDLTVNVELSTEEDAKEEIERIKLQLQERLLRTENAFAVRKLSSAIITWIAAEQLLPYQLAALLWVSLNSKSEASDVEQSNETLSEKPKTLLASFRPMYVTSLFDGGEYRLNPTDIVFPFQNGTGVEFKFKSTDQFTQKLVVKYELPGHLSTLEVLRPKGNGQVLTPATVFGEHVLTNHHKDGREIGINLSFGRFSCDKPLTVKSSDNGRHVVQLPTNRKLDLECHFYNRPRPAFIHFVLTSALLS